MATRFVIPGLVAILASFDPSPASASPLLAECTRAQVQELTVNGHPGFEEARNYCESPEMSAAFRELLLDVKEIHRRVADVFGITPEELFVEPLRLRFFVHAWGPLASYTSPSGHVGVGIHADWDGRALNQGIYSHELGHVIGLNPTGKLPQSLRYFANHPLMAETLSDLLALSVTGTVLSEGADLPRCLDRARYITDFQSYRYPVSYFDTYFTMRRVSQCCTSLLKGGDELSHAWKDVCSSKQMTRIASHLPPWEKAPLDSVQLENEAILPHGLPLDTHQVGIPITSFLFSLSREFGIPMADLLRNGLAHAEARVPPFIQASCELRAQPDVRATFAVPQVRLFLRAFAQGLTREEAARFDELWKKHGLEFSTHLDGVGRLDALWVAGTFELQRFLAESGHSCASQLDQTLECGATCGLSDPGPVQMKDHPEQSMYHLPDQVPESWTPFIRRVTAGPDLTF